MKRILLFLFSIVLLNSCSNQSGNKPLSTFYPTKISTAEPSQTPIQVPTLIPTIIPTPLGGSGEIAFISQSDNRGLIVIYQLNSGMTMKPAIQTASEGEEESPFGASSVFLSPDGLKIAFAYARCPVSTPSKKTIGHPTTWCRNEIYTANADGSNVVELTHNSVDDYEPTWSPDGSRIAFVSKRTGDYEIYVMNIDGSDVKRITDNPKGWDFSPAWSPDSKKIAFASQRPGNFQIYVMNADSSGGVVQLTKIKDISINPAWSPDGSKIAFSVYQIKSKQSDIYVMNSDGSNPTNITNGKYSPAGSPTWSPDGTMIAFVYESKLYRMNSDGSNVVKLVDADADSSVSWSAH